MKLTLQAIQAKFHNVKASGSMRLHNSKKGYQFIQEPSQIKALKKGTLAIIYGDAALAQFKKAKQGSLEQDAGLEFYTQANRYPNDQIASLLGRATETLHVQLRRSVVDEAVERGVKIIGVGFDGVIAKGIKESKGARSVMMVIIHHVPEKEFYLLEKWTFKKGRLQSLEELNISARKFDNPISDIASAIELEVNKASASGLAFKVSGIHGFTNREAAQILTRIKAIDAETLFCDEGELDQPLNVFNKRFHNVEFLNFETFTFPSPPITTGAKVKVNILTPAVIIIGGISAYYGLSEIGYAEYQREVQEYRIAIQQIRSVYEHGTAPISLVQTRQYFMEDYAKRPLVFHDSIAGIFAAVSKVHSEHPDAQAKFENITFNPNGLGGAHGESEFELTISFLASTERDVLPLGYELHQSLATYLNASTQTKDLPRSVGRNSLRYNLTITGTFR